MEAHVRAHAVEHDALEVVVEHDPRCPAEVREGLDVPAQEALHRLVEHEAGEQRPAEAHHHHEAHEIPLHALHEELAEVRPVHLPLLARHRLEREVGLTARRRPDRAHVAAKCLDAARVAALVEHLHEPRRAQRRVLLERGDDEGLVRVEHGGPRRLDARAEALDLDRAAHRVGVKAQLLGDGAHRPVLGEVEPADMRVLLAGDHRRSSSSRARSASSMRSCFRSRKSPSPPSESRTRGARALSTTSRE